MKILTAAIVGGLLSLPALTVAMAGATGENPAWAAPAQMNPDYDGEVKLLTEPAESSPGTAAPTADSTTTAESTDGPAWAAPATMNPDYESDASVATPSDGSDGAASSLADAASTSGDVPAWAAPAKMNPDYDGDVKAVTEPADANPSAMPVTTEAATEASPGDGTEGDVPAWAAPAKMNPDYAAGDTAPSAPASDNATAETVTPPPSSETVAPAAAAETAAPAEAPAAAASQGTTSYFGETARADDQPFRAPATMIGDGGSPAAQTAASDPSADLTPEQQTAIETCREALNGEAQAGKLQFRAESAALTGASNRTIRALAQIVKDCGPGYIIEVGGHTDSTGSAAGNKDLSERRAASVVERLTGAGVDTRKLKAVGYGQDRPVSTNDTREGRQANRRIEFLVIAE